MTELITFALAMLGGLGIVAVALSFQHLNHELYLARTELSRIKAPRVCDVVFDNYGCKFTVDSVEFSPPKGVRAKNWVPKVALIDDRGRRTSKTANSLRTQREFERDKRNAS